MRKGVLEIIAIIAVAAGLCAASYFGIGANKYLGIQHISLGLDLKGGVSITYEAGKEEPSAAEMASAVSMIQQRLDRQGYTEAECAKQGNDRIRVDIPGVEDAETAIAEIGQTAQIMFTDEEGNVLLDGSYIVNAERSVQNNLPVVALEFNDEGKRIFAQATEDNIGKRIIIWMDENPISMPTVNSKITGGNAVITGMSGFEEADELAALIRAGSLPFDLNIIEMSNVGAKLGADALSTGIMSGAAGIALVFIFMALVYRVSGLAANLALVIYVGLDLVVLSLMNVTLTLPGIAGIILSIGMAVDGNVIIFERIKEELRLGKSLRAALHMGFSKALSAIVDGNVTTLIAAAILFWLGTGTIRGFAQTLSLGIVISMFTCLVVTRAIIYSLMNAGIRDPRYFGAS